MVCFCSLPCQQLPTTSLITLRLGKKALALASLHYSLFKNFKKELFVLSLFSVPHDFFLTRSPQISGQNKSEAREPEGLVKMTYGIVAISLFKRAGNSN